MEKICATCRQEFIFSDDESKLYTELDVPTPDMCPSCRRQRRVLFRNFFHLYHRTCSLTGKKIISMYGDDAPYPVYDIHEWWGDRWDPLSFGIDVDWMKPFFEQVGVLLSTVPRLAMVSTYCENSDYCNMAVETKNSYLVAGCVKNENCMYGHIVWKCQDCIDCLYCYESRWCYECIDCVQCHGLSYSRDCDNCSDGMFLVHCIGCRDCFGCVGLQNKQYHIFNIPYSKQEYEQKMNELQTTKRSFISFATEKLTELIGKEIVKYYHGFDCENVTGDYLYHSRNVTEGYDLKNCEDVFHCATIDGFVNSQDCNFCGAAPGERCLSNVFVQGYEIAFCHNCREGSHLWYCDHCFSCKDCFGCVGLRNKRYCILNKQYSKEEYEALLPRLKMHMREHGEFGKFFPPELSPFGYNESIAYEYFPLTKQETLERGWKWHDDTVKGSQNYMGPATTVPDDTNDAPDSIANTILRCEASGKLYKILPQELRFYRSRKLPLPTLCFEERQRRRFAARNPRKLWKRNCAKCQKGIETTYAPERPETVYCEECYLASIY